MTERKTSKPRAIKEAPIIEKQPEVVKMSDALFAQIAIHSPEPVEVSIGHTFEPVFSVYLNQFVTIELEELRYLWDRILSNTMSERFCKVATAIFNKYHQLHGQPVPDVPQFYLYVKGNLFSNGLEGGRSGQTNIVRKYLKSADTFEERKRNLNKFMNSSRVTRDRIHNDTAHERVWDYWVGYEVEHMGEYAIKSLANDCQQTKRTLLHTTHIQRAHDARNIIEKVESHKINLRDAASQTPVHIQAAKDQEAARWTEGIPAMPGMGS